MQGQGVNLIVVDEGFSEGRLRLRHPGFAFGGGWLVKQPGHPLRLPGAPADPDSHGTMVARNILAVAPRVRLFDFPLLPDRITDVLQYMLWAQAQLNIVLASIAAWRALHLVRGPWVLCNAWGIYDRRLEFVPGDYTDNAKHPYNLRVTDADAKSIDQVYAAGNCGQFCPNMRCGPADHGPGQSIFGANSHPRVLTVGAVRADGLWLGYSSQGPGQADFLSLAPAGASAVEKPDLCAPSHFVEDGDAHFVSTGTSAACGIAAGTVAALRTSAAVNGAAATPAALRAALRAGARMPPTAPGPWNFRHGYGILDLRRTLTNILGVP
nr:S8 family serine peptidase [Siccirubricoccus soli]